jgi:hypothetical protein
MKSVKSIFGIMSAMGPVIYCGGLFFYFIDQGASLGDLGASGLGPTVIGVGVVGLLLFIPVIFKILRFVGGGAVRPEPVAKRGTPVEDDAPASSFDADAALARYMARKAAEEDDQPAPAPLAPVSGGVAPRSFGRKIV